MFFVGLTAPYGFCSSPHGAIGFKLIGMVIFKLMMTAIGRRLIPFKIAGQGGIPGVFSENKAGYCKVRR